MRVQAFDDIRAIADMFGNDLGSLAPPAEWLDVGEARRLLSNLQDKQWWHKLGAQAVLEPFTLDGQPLAVFLMEVFSGSGNLSYSAALRGTQVAGSPQRRLPPRPGPFRVLSLEFAQAFGSQNLLGTDCFGKPRMGTHWQPMHILGPHSSLETHT